MSEANRGRRESGGKIKKGFGNSPRPSMMRVIHPPPRKPYHDTERNTEAVI